MKKRNSDKRPTAERIRNMLQEDFQAKVSKNKRFSMRSYGRLLKLDHSIISRIISGERQATSAHVIKILKSGQFPGPESIELMNQALAEQYGKNKIVVTGTKSSLNIETEWAMIVAYLALEHPLLDSNKIATTLNIPQDTVDYVIGKLLAEGRIQLLQDGNFKFLPVKNAPFTLDASKLSAAEKKTRNVREFTSALNHLKKPSTLDGPSDRWFLKTFMVSSSSFGYIERLVKYLEETHFSYFKSGIEKAEKKKGKRKIQMMQVGIFAVPVWIEKNK